MLFYCNFSHGIEKIAWDASGERLALSFQGGDDMYDGLIAVYDIRRAPLISTSLVLVLLTSQFQLLDNFLSGNSKICPTLV